jgi:hypothetical protein
VYHSNIHIPFYGIVMYESSIDFDLEDILVYVAVELFS